MAEVRVSQKHVGYVIGKGGATINQLRERTGARLMFDQNSCIDGFSVLRIQGSEGAVKLAEDAVQELLQWDWKAETLAYGKVARTPLHQQSNTAWTHPPAPQQARSPSHQQSNTAWNQQLAPQQGGYRKRSQTPSRQPSESKPGRQGVSTKLLRAALSALLGKWYSFGSDGTLQSFEVAMDLGCSQTGCAQLVCRSWWGTDLDHSNMPKAERAIRFEDDDIFLGDTGNCRLFLDVVSEKYVTWVEDDRPYVQSQWCRGEAPPVKRSEANLAGLELIASGGGPPGFDLGADDFPMLEGVKKTDGLDLVVSAETKVPELGRPLQDPVSLGPRDTHQANVLSGSSSIGKMSEKEKQYMAAFQ